MHSYFQTPFQPYTKPGPKVSFSAKLRYNDSFDGEHKTLQIEVWKSPSAVRHFWEHDTPLLLGNATDHPTARKLYEKQALEAESVLPRVTAVMEFGDFLKKKAPSTRHINASNMHDNENPLKHKWYQREVALLPEDFQMTPLKKYAKQSPLKKYRKGMEVHVSQKLEGESPTRNNESKLSHKQYHDKPDTFHRNNCKPGVSKLNNKPKCDDHILDILDDGKFNKEHVMSKDYFKVDFGATNTSEVEEEPSTDFRIYHEGNAKDDTSISSMYVDVSFFNYNFAPNCLFNLTNINIFD